MSPSPGSQKDHPKIQTTSKTWIKALLLYLCFPDCVFQVREDQELGYFPQIFLQVFAAGLGQMRKQTCDTLSTASFPRGGIFLPTTKHYKQSFLPQPVLLARRAPVSLRLHLRGAGNSSFSPYPPKILGVGALPNEGRKNQTS